MLRLPLMFLLLTPVMPLPAGQQTTDGAADMPPAREVCDDCGIPWTVHEEALYPREARPHDGWLSWVSAADFPAALREARFGADVELAISPRGALTACRVTDPSGSRAWDRALCAILRRRARFDPALDARGKAIGGKWTHRYVVEPVAGG